MTDRDYAPLSTACVRALNDKLYDKRKTAAIEIDKMVKDFHAANNVNQIRKLIRVLQEFATAHNPNTRNGGLIGLGAIAVALEKDISLYLNDLINPVLACFSDAEFRVRYFSCEALYNIVKVARGGVLTHFTDIFNALSNLCTDPYQEVKNASEMLDRLMKDIVTESSEFDLCAFIPLLRERIYSQNSFARQFIISWVSVLDAVPDIDLVIFLPDLLDGLFTILEDHEIRKMCETQLAGFLRSIKNDPSRVNFAGMINVLIVHAQSPDELLQLTAITWIKEFVQLSGADMLPRISGIFMAILPCLSYNGESRRKSDIKETAAAVNFSLMKLITMDSVENQTQQVSALHDLLDLPSIVEVLSQHLHHNSVQTKVAVLRWILHLYNKIPAKMYGHTDRLYSGLLGSLSDQSDDVVRQSLAVLAEICSSTVAAANPNGEGISDVRSSPYYRKLLVALLKLLAADTALLDDRGAFIVRQLCVLLNAEDIYRTLSEILLEEEDLKFASTVVDTLNTILLTSAELYDLRTFLKEFCAETAKSLFIQLYKCWSHSPIALAALCLLTHNYQHCNRLIRHFGDLEITVDFLTEIDKLVQLIESPIFAYVRLELLEDGSEGESLRGALYGLLMLLPQTDAFHTLRRRLQCAPLSPPPPSGIKRTQSMTKSEKLRKSIDFEALVQEFLKMQVKHRKYKLEERAKKLTLLEAD